MANIFILPADVFLHIFTYLDTDDMIAIALTSKIFRQLCVDAKVFRKMDFSRHLVSTMLRRKINKFFRDRQLTQHIRELNLSNLRVLNWQMDDQLEEFISICPQLEALHVLDCGMSLQRLCRILKQAPKLTALSWSLWDFTSKDIQFLSKSMKSSEGTGLKNIKHLHLQTFLLVPHIQIAKYLVLSCFRDLEELEMYTWQISKHRWSFPLAAISEFIPDFPQPSVENELQHLHRLTVAALPGPLFVDDDDTYKRKELSDFVISVLSKKSSSTKWKKLWILPTIGISTSHLSDFSRLLNQDDFQSIEAISANPVWLANTVDEVKTFFKRIGGNTVRSLNLYLPSDRNLTHEFCEPILRVGGHSLKRLHLSVHRLEEIAAEQNVLFDSLFSNCLNITELDLLCCCFEKGICEPLSKLWHLTKVQLMECAISSKHWNKYQVETSKANFLTFVENCKNITHFDVRGCHYDHVHFSCYPTEDDLLALEKLRSLKSLTLFEMSDITRWSFLQSISKHCKFLTTLRITAWGTIDDDDIETLMESTKFLQHLAINVDVPVAGSEEFWNLLSRAKNLQRLCITSDCWESLNVPVALEALKSLPRLHVLHLHNRSIKNIKPFYDHLIRILKEKESDCRFSFEIVVRNRKKTWVNHETGYSLISNKALPLNEAELCCMEPIMDIPWL